MSSSSPSTSEMSSFKSCVLQSDMSTCLSMLSDLRSRRHELSNEKQRLAFEHYPVFIATSNTCKKAIATLEHQRDEVSALATDSVPGLLAVLEHFTTLESEFAKGRKLASLLLNKHGKLLELLELPQLMQTCIRADHYEEALAITHMVARINKSMAIKADALKGEHQATGDEAGEEGQREPLTLVVSLHKSTQRCLQTLIDDLLIKLRSPLSLVESLRLVGLLRRTQHLDETQLRLAFLKAKRSHFTQLMRKTTSIGIGSSSSSSRLIESARQTLFDCVSQYRALFADDDLKPNRHLLSMWIHSNLNSMRHYLTANFHNEVNFEDDSLKIVIEQLLYFGQSLGRAGFDNRLFFAPLMSELIEHQISRHLRDAKQHWIQSLRAERLFRLPPQRLTQHEGETDDVVRRKVYEADVMRFHALSEITNRIIMTFNSFRVFPLAHSKPMMTSDISMLLETMLNSLSGHVGSDAKERAYYLAIEKCFHSSFLPLIKIYWQDTFASIRIEEEIGLDSLQLCEQVYGHQRRSTEIQEGTATTHSNPISTTIEDHEIKDQNEAPNETTA